MVVVALVPAEFKVYELPELILDDCCVVFLIELRVKDVVEEFTTLDCVKPETAMEVLACKPVLARAGKGFSFRDEELAGIYINIPYMPENINRVPIMANISFFLSGFIFIIFSPCYCYHFILFFL